MEYHGKLYGKIASTYFYTGKTSKDFDEMDKKIKEYEEKLRWISVEEKEPECEIQDEGIFYSKYLEIKVKGYEHPIIGYYIKANDDQFFDFIYSKIGEEILQTDVTHYRFIL